MLMLIAVLVSFNFIEVLMLRSCMCSKMHIVNAVVTDVKQRRMFSPIPVVESQPVSSSVSVVAPPSVGYENTEVSAEEKHAGSIMPENLAASASATVSQTEDVAHLSGKPELIDLTADSVSESVSQLSLMSTDDSDTDDTEVEIDNAKIQQQNVVKSEITTTADESAGASISSDDVSVKDAEGHESSTHLTAASEQTQLQQVAVNSQNDAKIQQQNVVKSEITTTADEGAGASISSDDVSAKDAEGHESSMTAALEQTQLQQVTVNSQDTEAGCEDSPAQTGRDVDDTTSSRVSTYQSDVAIYKQEARSNDVDAAADRKQEARSGSTSETFTSCLQSGTDSVFCSPQSDISDSKMTNNNDSLCEQQGVQHSVGDTAVDSSEIKMVIYSHSNSSTAGPDSSAAGPDSSNFNAGLETSIAGPESSITCPAGSNAGPESFTASERRHTESECTQSMSTTEKKTDKDDLDHHSESSMNMESEEPIEGDKDKGSDINVDDSADDDDDDDEDDEDDDDDEGDDGKEDDVQEQSTVDKKTAVEPQKNKGGVSMSRKAKKKSVKKEKEKKKKERKKKKIEEQMKQTHSAAVAKTSSSSGVKSEAGNVESPPIARPLQMQSETMNSDGQTENKATQSRTFDNDTNANVSSASGAVNRHDSQEGSSTKDTHTGQQSHAQTSSSGTDNTQVGSCCIFDLIY